MYDEEVSNYDQEIEFVTGFAGSGKSTDLAENTTKTTIVLTPTHAAAAVLQAKGIEQVFTIHSVLRLVPTINENFKKGQKLQVLRKIGDVDLKSINLIVIDEFSMIPTKIMDMLLELLPEHAKVKVYGDGYQLPPVDGERIYPEEYSNNIRTLNNQYRSKAPRTTETFMRFVHFLDGTGKMDLRVIPKAGTDLVKADKDWAKQFNPDSDRALAYTNVKVLQINGVIAKALKLPEDISEGENILINDIACVLGGKEARKGLRIFPTCISKGSLMTDDALIMASTKTMGDIVKFHTDLTMYETKYAVFDEAKYLMYVDFNHYENSKKLKAEVEKTQQFVWNNNTIPEDVSLKDWCGANKHAPGVRDRAKAWSAFLTHSNLVFNVRRPFATTVHKSQGREFSVVYISLDDIKKLARGRYPNYESYARMVYVALSRAIDKVVLIP